VWRLNHGGLRVAEEDQLEGWWLAAVEMVRSCQN
jgi:hypothetical protein